MEARIEELKKEKREQTDSVPYSKILFSYSDGCDKFLMWIGYFMALVTGLGLPSFTFLFGDIVNDFSKLT